MTSRTSSRLKFSLLLLFTFSASALAVTQEIYEFSTPEQEALYKELTYELRCLVCQNQNLADSNADLALDLRRKSYEMVTAGASKQQVVDFMVQRYGEFVLYKPRMGGATLLLWLGPFLLLGLALAVGFFFVRRNRAAALQVQDAPSEQERQHARDLLNG